MKTKKEVLICVILMCCFCLFAQTRHYQPVSQYEQSFYDACTREVFPDDVRENPDDYAETLVAWVGLIDGWQVDDSYDEYNVLWLHVEQRYFDWIEDFYYETPINLSSKGEGFFTTYYLLRKDADYTQLFSPGDCVICYGYPVYPEEDYLLLPGQYIRFISAQYVNSNWMPYGREGLMNMGQ